jgi:hypothetical protein
MSRTYKDIRKWKTKRFWDDYYNNVWEHQQSYWAAFRRNDSKQIQEFVAHNKEYKTAQQLYTDYSGAPSWWARLYMNRPARRKQNGLLHTALKLYLDSDELVFPLSRKPFVYYW